MLDAIDRHNEKFLRKKGRLLSYRADCATIVAPVDGIWRQFAQVGFMKADGSIRVEWPYLAVRQGIVGSLVIPNVPKGTPVTHKLLDAGKFTSQLMKLSHHRSGEALFSKTGHALTKIRRQSFPLDSSIGRVFEITAYHPSKFKELRALKTHRLYVAWPEIAVAGDGALLIRGEWRRREHLVQAAHVKRASIGPRTGWLQKQTGAVEPVLFIGQPLDYGLRDFFLCVAAAPVAPPTGTSESGLICIGGFNEHVVPVGGNPEDHRITDALIAMYPTTANDAVVAAAGTLDFSPSII